MNEVLAIYLYSLIGWTLLLMGGTWLFKKITVRYFPKYVAKRQLRAKQRSDRSLEKYRQRKADEKARLATWVENNPDDPVAQALMLEKLVDIEFDPLAELRRRQQETDELDRRLKDWRKTESLRSRRTLEWALVNPTVPEARRHLEEALEEANKQHERAVLDASFEARGYGSPDEALARQAVQEELISEIKAALGETIPAS